VRKWWLLGAVILGMVAGSALVLAQQGATVNPLPGSVWTYLGATFGADWVAPATPATGGLTTAISFGAKCDGVTNDAPALNSGTAAIAAAGGGVLFMPAGKTCAVAASVTVPSNVKLMGAGFNSAIKALTANMTVISITGSYSGLESLQILCSTGVASTSGNCVNIAAVQREILLRDFRIYEPYTGIATTSSVLVTIKDGYIYDPTPTTGRCMLINGGNNQVISNVFCQGKSQAEQPQFGFEIQATQGIWLNNVQALWAGNAMYLDPGDGQVITWVFDTQSAYDTGSGNGIAIVPSGTGSVRGYYCMGCWTSTMQISGVVVAGGGSTAVDDVHFVGHRSFNNQQHGFTVAAVQNLVIQDSSICGNSGSSSGTYDGIKMVDTTHVMIQGNTIGNCAGFGGGSQHAGVNVDGVTTDQLSVIANRLSGNVVPGSISNFDWGKIAVIRDNMGWDDQLPAVATATSITLPLNPTLSLTGTTNVQNITGGWQGRQVWILPTGVFQFVGGGTSGLGIGNPFTTQANVPVLATFVGTAWWFIHG
jgi:hypothetical protein